MLIQIIGTMFHTGIEEKIPEIDANTVLIAKIIILKILCGKL